MNFRLSCDQVEKDLLIHHFDEVKLEVRDGDITDFILSVGIDNLFIEVEHFKVIRLEYVPGKPRVELIIAYILKNYIEFD